MNRERKSHNRFPCSLTGNSSQGAKERAMPPKRKTADNMTYHLVTRCNNKEHKFKSDKHFDRYLSMLQSAKRKFGFKLYAYCLMRNHVHIIMEVKKAEELMNIMAWINWRYAIWYNRSNNLTGHFWEDRFYSSAITSDEYLLACMRYLDLNPVRARITETQNAWKYSTFRIYASSVKRPFIDLPDTYMELGRTKEERRAAYIDLFPAEITKSKLI
jgi:putative transposase